MYNRIKYFTLIFLIYKCLLLGLTFYKLKNIFLFLKIYKNG